MCCLYLDIFSCVKINVFRFFFAFRLETHVRCDNQYKTGADRGIILGQLMLFECMGICVLSPAHESEMRGYPVYLLIVKYLLVLFQFSHSIFDWTALLWNFLGFFKTFLEGSVDSIIYRDYTANRRHLFTVVWPVLAGRLASTC